MSIDAYIENERRDFVNKEISIKNVPDTPFPFFQEWMKQAVEQKIIDANAMVISTVNKNLQPSSRVVLLRGFSKEGLVFFTNYDSQKAQDLEQNPLIAINFFWALTNKQIRINGKVEKLPEKDSENYFSKRPRGSQLGAWASEQSKKIDSRVMLMNDWKTQEKKYEGKDVPKPPNWGGYIVRPNYFEFWQGRESRLHDRIIYEMEETNWVKYRISP